MAKKPTGGGAKPPPPPPPPKKPPERHTSKPEAILASNVLAGRITPTPAQVKTLAASVLSQDAPKKGK